MQKCGEQQARLVSFYHTFSIPLDSKDYIFIVKEKTCSRTGSTALCPSDRYGIRPSRAALNVRSASCRRAFHAGGQHVVYVASTQRL